MSMKKRSTTNTQAAIRTLQIIIRYWRIRSSALLKDIFKNYQILVSEYLYHPMYDLSILDRIILRVGQLILILMWLSIALLIGICIFIYEIAYDSTNWLYTHQLKGRAMYTQALGQDVTGTKSY